MSRNSNDVSLLFEKPPDLSGNFEPQVDEKIKANVPDLSVFSEIASENENAESKWKSTISRNKYCKSSVQQETLLSSTTYKKQYDSKEQCHSSRNQVLHQSNYCSSKCELSPLQNHSFQNGAKSNKRATAKISLNNFSANLFEKRDYFTFSDNVMEHIRQQDKKFDDLQNQISLFLQSKDVCCPKMLGLVQNNPKVKELDKSFVLMCIKEHSDKICNLQGQIDLLLNRTEKLESLCTRIEKLESLCARTEKLESLCARSEKMELLCSRIEKLESFCARTEKLVSGFVVKERDVCNGASSSQISPNSCEIFPNGCQSSPNNYLISPNSCHICPSNCHISPNNCQISPNGCQISPSDDRSSILGDQSYEADQNEMGCHKEKKVKKTSTSTMTSLTVESNDKLVFRKMLTVVTDVSNCQKDVSVQVSSRGIDTETERAESGSPKNEITSKSANAKKAKRKSLKSPQKSVSKNKKSNQVYQETLSPSDAYSAATLPKFRATNPDSASSDSDRENKMVHNILSPKEKILFEISRNIDQHLGTQDLSSHLKNNLPKCVSKGCKTKNPPPPILSSTERNKNCHETSSRSSSATSNTSEDTVYASPNQQDKVDYPVVHSTRDSSVVSKYGMSSPNLSLATKLYLDKFGLVHQSEPEEKTERQFSRKHRTSDGRRQLR